MIFLNDLFYLRFVSDWWISCTLIAVLWYTQIIWQIMGINDICTVAWAKLSLETQLETQNGERKGRKAEVDIILTSSYASRKYLAV